MRRAAIFWFTGLSGAGKTTVADGVKALLMKQGIRVLTLDGDDVRNRLHVKLKFTKKDIRTNNHLIAKLCQKTRNRYDVILVPIISPYRASRHNARRILKEKFFEIYFSASLRAVSKRDCKGLYAKAKKGEIKNLIGFSKRSIYEPPLKADFVIDSAKEPKGRSIKRFYRFIISQIS